MKLLDWANDLRSAVGLGPDDPSARSSGAAKPRRDVSGHKVIVRQRKALGIIHLKNLSSKGGCGLTDMPLAVGSLVFLELRKPHFWAAEVRWARSLSIGLEFFRPVRPEMFEKLHGPPGRRPSPGSRRNGDSGRPAAGASGELVAEPVCTRR